MTPAKGPKGRADKLAERIGAKRAQIDRTAHHALETHAEAARIEEDRAGRASATRDVAIEALRVSPFQPRTRPSPLVVALVRREVEAAGGPQAFAEAFFSPGEGSPASAPAGSPAGWPAGRSTVEGAGDAAGTNAVRGGVRATRETRPVGRSTVERPTSTSSTAGAVGDGAAPESATESATDSALARRFGGAAYEFARLVASVALEGVREPVEVRETPTGPELLTGHRRRAAAALVGLAVLPTRSRGVLSDAEAAAIVLRDNLLREDPQPWEEALGLAHAQTTARAEGRPATVAALAAQFGYSAGRVSELLAIARAFTGEVLRDVGGGDADAGEAAVAGLPYRQLRVLLGAAETPGALVAAARRAAGIESRPVDVVPTVQRSARRGGGYTLTVAAPVDTLAEADAAALVEALRLELRRAEARLREVRRPARSDAGSGARGERSVLRPRRKRRG